MYVVIVIYLFVINKPQSSGSQISATPETVQTASAWGSLSLQPHGYQRPKHKALCSRASHYELSTRSLQTRLAAMARTCQSFYVKSWGSRRPPRERSSICHHGRATASVRIFSPVYTQLEFFRAAGQIRPPLPPTKGEVQLANAIRQQVRLPVQRVKVTPSSVYIRVKTIKALISVMARGKARIKVHPLLLWSQREPP